MKTLKLALSGLLLVASASPSAGAADIHVDIIHRSGPREPPPPVRVEHYGPRRGYVWEDGHYEWRRKRYVWRRGHYRHERQGFEWRGGRWEQHEDHYDWHRGEWHPHR